MEKEFIPYEQALDLKELGFDEPCLGYYTSTGYFNSKKELKWRKWQFSYNFQPISNKQLTWKDSKTENVQQVVVPLYQQAFRWFREKYNIECYVNCYWNEVDSSKRDYYVNYNYGSDIFYSINIGFKTYEEAELECLKKLIEIIKNK